MSTTQKKELSMYLDPEKIYIYYNWPYKAEVKFSHYKPGQFTFEVIQAWSLIDTDEEIEFVSHVALDLEKLERLTDPDDIITHIDEL